MVISQAPFRVARFDSNYSEADIFAVLRAKNPLSLILKTIVLVELFGFSKVKKNKSDFLMVKTGVTKDFLEFHSRLDIMYKRLFEPYSLNDRSRIVNVNFCKTFNISIVIIDIVDIVKQAKIENLYDFFNWPIKFNSTIKLSPKDYIKLSLYGI